MNIFLKYMICTLQKHSLWGLILVFTTQDVCCWFWYKKNDPCFCKVAFDQWLLLLHEVFQPQGFTRYSASSNCCCCMCASETCTYERMHFFPFGKCEKVACLFPSNECMPHLQNPTKTTEPPALDSAIAWPPVEICGQRMLQKSEKNLFIEFRCVN